MQNLKEILYYIIKCKKLYKLEVLYNQPALIIKLQCEKKALTNFWYYLNEFDQKRFQFIQFKKKYIYNSFQKLEKKNIYRFYKE